MVVAVNKEFEKQIQKILKNLRKNTISYCIKAITTISILHEIFTLALDLKIIQFQLDMNDINDIIIILMNLYYRIILI